MKKLVMAVLLIIVPAFGVAEEKKENPIQWKPAFEPKRDYYVQTTYAKMKSKEEMLRFASHVGMVEAVLKKAPGLLYYSFYRNIPALEVRTISVWEDEDAIDNFVYGKTHMHVMDKLADASKDSKFKQFRLKGDKVPTTWSAVIKLVSKK